VPRNYADTEQSIRNDPATWLVTGAAGFIGSNLVERLLDLGQQVVGLDNFATGYRHNLDDVARAVGANRDRFRFIEGDIRDLQACREACAGVDYVLHQAALGSVPRSVEDPIATNAANIDGFVNMLVASRDAKARRFVYAASSAAYGDHPGLPKVEDEIGRPLSPYAVSKVANELYADVFGQLYDQAIIGLRYFNVFGPRQDPAGAYAAVIPAWVGRMLDGQPCQIFGDGTATRDFCFVENAVQANLLSATVTEPEAIGQTYNIACGERTSLTELFDLIRERVAALRPELTIDDVERTPPRPGDIEHSLADISKARRLLGYEPALSVAQGLDVTAGWFVEAYSKQQ